MLSDAYAFVPLAHLLVQRKKTPYLLSYRGAGRHRRATPRLLEPHSKSPAAGMLPRYRAVISEYDVIAHEN